MKRDASSVAMRLRSGVYAVLLLAAVLAGQFAGGCKRSEPTIEPRTIPRSASRVFSDVTQEAGITHTHEKPVLDSKLDHIMSWMCSVGAAAAAGDYDNDGHIDLYVTNSHKGSPNFLYRNNGDGTFTDVASAAGVGDVNNDSGTSMDCIWADYDNDGWKDLYLLRWGKDILYRNNGDGTFSDVTERCFRQRDGSQGTQWANGNGVIAWDYNMDGRLDFYVGNYFEEVDLWHLKSTRIMHNDFERARNGGRNFLYVQNSDGTFEEIAETLGMEDPGWTLAVGVADLNNDGWPDLYCADDFGPDQLFLSRRDGTFENVTDSAIGFDSKKGMNVDFGDFNNDGWLDVYVTNITTSEYLQEGNMLWHNNGIGEDGQLTLTDVSLETETYDGGWGWGAKFFDYDSDGDLDLIAGNGFISAGEGNFWYDLASWTVTGDDSADAANWPAIGDRSFSGYEQIRFWRNDGLYVFTPQAENVGIDTRRDTRGIVCFDYDNDGDLDVFLANQGQPPQLYRNDGVVGNHWLMVELQADPKTGVTKDALGTRVTVVTSEGTQIRERDGGNGYASQSDQRLHFGLGTIDRIALVEVRWPDGGVEYFEDVHVDQVLKLRQDPSRYASQFAIEVAPPTPWRRTDEESQHAPPAVPPEEMDRMLSEMEAALRSRPKEFAPASAYRARCVLYEKHDRAVRFFQSLVEKDPSDVRARVELGNAFIDKIPTCGGLAAIVSKGSLAKKALNQVDPVIEKNPDLWYALYCRGMNHLHWPRALRHSDDAAADLAKCIELQRQRAPDNPPKYYLRTHVALGDAHAKYKEYDKARKVWRDALKKFPKSKELKERLAISKNGDLLKYVESKRSLEQPIDTGLGFLDRQ